MQEILHVRNFSSYDANILILELFLYMYELKTLHFENRLECKFFIEGTSNKLKMSIMNSKSAHNLTIFSNYYIQCNCYI